MYPIFFDGNTYRATKCLGLLTLKSWPTSPSIKKKEKRKKEKNHSRKRSVLNEQRAIILLLQSTIIFAKLVCIPCDPITYTATHPLPVRSPPRTAPLSFSLAVKSPPRRRLLIPVTSSNKPLSLFRAHKHHLPLSRKISTARDSHALPRLPPPPLAEFPPQQNPFSLYPIGS